MAVKFDEFKYNFNDDLKPRLAPLARALTGQPRARAFIIAYVDRLFRYGDMSARRRPPSHSMKSSLAPKEEQNGDEREPIPQLTHQTQCLLCHSQMKPPRFDRKLNDSLFSFFIR
jgi:hypothetical protein